MARRSNGWDKIRGSSAGTPAETTGTRSRNRINVRSPEVLRMEGLGVNMAFQIRSENKNPKLSSTNITKLFEKALYELGNDILNNKDNLLDKLLPGK